LDIGWRTEKTGRSHYTAGWGCQPVKGGKEHSEEKESPSQMSRLNCRPATACHLDPPRSQSVLHTNQQCTFVGLSCHKEVYHALVDIAAVIWEFASKPTRASGLVQKILDYIGYCDARTS
jgi:hypothetical protein